MPFLFVVLYGLLSGFFDVLPVSSFAHQSLLQNVFGVSGSLHLFNLLCHLSSCGALIFALMPSLTALLREQRIASLPRRKMQGERKLTYDLRFLKSAVFAATIASVSMSILSNNRSKSLWLIGILCVINGALVLIPEYLPWGNKTAKHLNRLDSVAFGAISGLGIFPGISRVTLMQFYATTRGADRSRACNWMLLVTIPILAVLAFFDLAGMITAGIGTQSFLSILSYILGAALSFVGTFAGVTLTRFLSAKVGFAGFGYYNIGAGLLLFFLYLTV